MAVFEVGCMEATLRMDTDNDLITIERKSNIKFSVPQKTEIKLSEVTNVEHKFFGAVIIRGTGAFRFVYPGCPTGGSMLTGFSTNENMVQYSGRHKPEADAFIAALVPIVKANRARLQA